MRYDEPPLWEEKYLTTYKRYVGTLPYLYLNIMYKGKEVEDRGWFVGWYSSLLAETCGL